MSFYVNPVQHKLSSWMAKWPSRMLSWSESQIKSINAFLKGNLASLCYDDTIKTSNTASLVTRKSHPPNWYQVFSIIFNQLIEGRVTSWVVRCLMKVNLIHMLIFTRWWVGTVWFKEDTHISPIVTLRVRLKMTKINSQVNNSYPFWPMNPYKNLKNYIIKFILKYIIKILNSMIMSVIIWFCNFCSIFEIV